MKVQVTAVGTMDKFSDSEKSQSFRLKRFRFLLPDLSN
jgi:hypothetical protein